MAHIANRSRFRVTVKNKPDLTQHFSFSKVAAVEAYMKELRAQGYKPRAEPTPPVLSSTVLWKPGVNLASFAPAF